MPIHNPLPSNMEAECRKCGKILASFIDPNRAFSPDKIIPSSILANAKGLVILTVFKAGFLGSARYGNGVVVAKLSDGSWSAPSAVGAGGAGFGGQIGIELTDFVFILNDRAAVRTLSQMGSLTLGGNISVAAGPMGRTAEAAGAASFKSVAAIFSYSRTKGFFAGVSFEGSVIVERRDANERLYGQRYTAYQLLNGSIPVPDAAQPMIKVLNSRIFTGINAGPPGHYSGNPSRTQGDNDHTTGYSDRRTKFRENFSKNRYNRVIDRTSYRTSRPRRSVDDINTRPGTFVKTNNPRRSVDGYYIKPDNGSTLEIVEDYVYTDTPSPAEGSERQKTMKQAILKPMFPSLSKNQAVAIETFKPEQPGDLGFEKGDLITVTQSSGSKNDWWTGMNGKNTGIFPARYVEMKD
ncbi:SH3 domain-containing protein [Erysiphe neolycopersici]|uniref:SH3 domain-containing protein n=1 Tax=Erysiphe neolycopersici TaxID=212602 RepID=A0A420HD98_9PEZI|nr:SH3 domain-containing protein [Erysiphe neolycopersici]